MFLQFKYINRKKGVGREGEKERERERGQRQAVEKKGREEDPDLLILLIKRLN